MPSANRLQDAVHGRFLDCAASEKIELVKLQYGGAAHGPVRGIGVVGLLHTVHESDEF